jgi:hypothetical protein
VICAKTVTKKDFSIENSCKSEEKFPIKENWLYRTKAPPVIKDPKKDAFGYSEDGPDWFKVGESNLVKDHRFENSQGYDGTMTILSRISGWITVSPHSRNRQKRLGRYGPFDKSKKGFNFQNVSDLAPSWMQGEYQRIENPDFKNQIAPANLRKEQKRVFLVEKEPTKKSVFSYGDYRHDVMTSEEAKNYSTGLYQAPQRFIEWKEEVKNQKFDKPITGKIGSRY